MLLGLLCGECTLDSPAAAELDCTVDGDCATLAAVADGCGNRGDIPAAVFSCGLTKGKKDCC